MSNDHISELRAQVEYLDAELRGIHEGAADRSLTEDEQSRWDDGVWLRHALIAQGIDHEARAQVLASAAVPARTEAGDGTRDAGFQIRKQTDDPFEYRAALINADTPRAAATELRGRALKAIEQAPYMTDEHREQAAAHVEHGAGREAAARAQHILDHGSPAYHEAFQAVVATPQNPGLALAQVSQEAQRAALSLTGANGGYLVPFTLDPSVILTNSGTVNPFREIATVKTTATNSWNGVTSAGVTAEWVAEATQVADASPTFAQPSIPVFKADAYVQGSLEVIADSAVSGEIVGLIADAKSRLESTAFAVGNGTTAPQGIVTALGLVTASRVAGSSATGVDARLAVADIYALDNDLGARFRPNASFLGNKVTWNALRQLGTANNYHAFWTDFGGGLPANLIGYPVYESSEMDSTVVSGSNDDVIVLGDFRYGYYIVDRMGMELAFNPIVNGANQRPTGESAWVAFWRTGAEAVVPEAFRMLRL